MDASLVVGINSFVPAIFAWFTPFHITANPLLPLLISPQIKSVIVGRVHLTVE